MPLSAAQNITATFTSNADLASGNVNISYSYLEGGSQVSYLINQLSITAKANNTSTGTTSSAGGNASGSSGGSFDFICLLILLMFNRTINVNKVK